MTDTRFVYFDAHDKPFTLHGLVLEDGYARLPAALLPALRPPVRRLATQTAGGRIRFRTDAAEIRVKILLNDTCIKTHMTPLNMAGAELYGGAGADVERVCVLRPKAHGEVPFEKLDGYYLDKMIEQTIPLSGKMTTYTLFLPVFTAVDAVSVGFPQGKTPLAPEPYQNALPLVFYGSSITQGACAGRPSLIYPAQVSAALQSDYVDLGFAGQAQGEIELANYIASLPMRAFILDYDHNAPDVEWLKKTHGAFFHAVRIKQPELPILLVTRPGGGKNPADTEARYEVIARTYQAALDAGDQHVALLDGRTLFPQGIEDQCLEDMVHPNDLGFYFMARGVLSALNGLLKNAPEAG